MKLLAIDPGKNHHAWSSWHNGKLVDYGKKIRYDLSFWKALISSHDMLYVEDQFYGVNAQKAGKRVRDIFALVEARSELTTIAKLEGIPTVVIPPKRWQSKVLKVGRKAKRKELKHLSKEIASAIAQDKIVDHDIADAICMGMAIVAQLNQEENADE